MVEVTIQSGEIGKNQELYNCESIKRIVIGSDVTKIYATYSLEWAIGPTLWIGKQFEAFVVSEENPYYKSVNGVLYTRDGKILLSYPENRRGEHFDIPEGVEKIHSAAFYSCNNLTSVKIPLSVSTIYDGAFAGIPKTDDFTIYCVIEVQPNEWGLEWNKKSNWSEYRYNVIWNCNSSD